MTTKTPKTPVDTPRVSPDNKPFVTRIYITKGTPSSKPYSNTTCDKRIGFMINNKLHWLKQTFTHTSELHHILTQPTLTLGSKANNNDFSSDFGTKFRLGVKIDNNDEWVNVRQGAWYFTQKLTRIFLNHDDVFNENSIYMEKAVAVRPNDYFWTVSEIEDKYYSDKITLTA